MTRSIVPALVLAAACSNGPDSGPGPDPGAGTRDAGSMLAVDAVGADPSGADAAAASDASSGADAATASDAAAGNDASAPGDAASGGDAAVELVELPAGSRELDHVVNLVDEAAADQVEQFLMTLGMQVDVTRSEALALPVNLFVEHYLEVYDFVFFFTDHSLQSGAIGRFEHINLPAAPGGSSEIEVRAPTYRTDGRLMGAIAVQWRAMVGPPLAHEVMHQWAVRLDRRFGFGNARAGDDPVHWGYTSVNGQLGGFDGAQLRCETPGGASPPGCTPLASGRVRYVAPNFSSFSNSSALYGPLELYLMGLLTTFEVPASFQMLEDAETEPDSYDPTTGTVVVEAAGMVELPFADIVARHGEVALRAMDARAFSAAFVVVSRQAASDEVMADVAEWAAAFGNRGTSGVVTAFETLTGDRATLDTRLGPRRSVSDLPAEPRPPLLCDVLAQDCPRSDLGCYGLGPSFCGLAGAAAEGSSCERDLACAPGHICVSGASNLDAYSCNPFCDPDDAASELACETVCPGMQIVINDTDQQRLGAFCIPP